MVIDVYEKFPYFQFPEFYSLIIRINIQKIEYLGNSISQEGRVERDRKAPAEAVFLISNNYG